MRLTCQGGRGPSVTESPRNKKENDLNRGLQEFCMNPSHRQPANATELLPAALPKGEAQNATSLMYSVGKIPLCGTFPRLPTLCLLKSVFTAWRRPSPQAAASQRGHQAAFQRQLGSPGQPSAGTWPQPPENLGFCSSSKYID